VLAVVLATYAHLLDDWFVSDDFWYLRAAQVAKPSFFLNSFDYTADGPVPESVYRPLYPITFLFVYKLFGLNAWQYHLLNIVLHMANITLFWLIVRKLTGRVVVANVAAFIFGLHPVYSPAIAWITNNVSLFALMFALSSMLLFLRFLDGDGRRWLFYTLALLTMLIAMLLHPESMAALGAMMLLYGARRVRRAQDLRSPMLYVPVLPFLAAAIGLLGLLDYIRAHDPYQAFAFGWGRHTYDYFLIYIAHLGNPYGVDPQSALQWRSLLPIVGVASVAGWLLIAARSFDIRLRLVVCIWLVLAVLPLTTFNYEVQSRKLYVAGAPFALVIAMAAVAAWDEIATSVGRLDWRAPDVRYLVAASAMVLVCVALPLRGVQLTDRKHMASASLTGLDGQSYKGMIQQINETHPALSKDTRLVLIGLPWTVTFPFNELDSRLVDAVRIYYGDIDVTVPGSKTAPDPGNYMVQLTCPPVCGLPPPDWLIAAIYEAQHPSAPLPEE
jgi:hypothetical protein